MTFTQQQIKVLTKASTDFVYFINNIFNLSIDHFIRGEHIDNTARFLSQNKRTIRVSARNHFKSFSFYAYFMWKLMFDGAVSDIEAQYFSFNSELAAYHISKIKKCISSNPYFADIIDGKPLAESVLKYSWDRIHWTTLHPHGLIQFKRGIHADLIFVDDPFQDPENELNQTTIFKINEVFRSNILDMPKEPDGELHVAGCLDPGTNILMSDGSIKVLRDIKITDEIIGYDFISQSFKPIKIIKLVNNGIQNTKLLKLDNGLEIRSTFNHPFYTKEGWKELSELKIGDFIAVLSETHTTQSYDRTSLLQTNIKWLKIKSIGKLKRQNTLNLTVEGGNFVANGILTHNTPQTNNDFFFDKDLTSRFQVKIQPAIQINPITQEEFALWPEWMSLEELYKKREERGKRIFSKEYLCTPVYSTKGFFNKDVLIAKTVNKNLVMLNAHLKHVTANEVIAGFDIGKKTHPSHLIVFEKMGDKLITIHHKFMDGWNYSNGKEFYNFAPTQLEYLKMCIKNFGIRRLKYDNTRGEFEAYYEQGLIPRQMEPVILTSKFRSAGAAYFDKIVERSQIEIPDDQRLINQICAVMSDLQAIETAEGHGDAFWSTVLGIMCAPDLVGFITDETQTDNRNKIKTGQKSIFAEGVAIPRGF